MPPQSSSSEPAPAAWAELPTEQRNPRSRDLDQISTAAAVRLLLEEDRRGLEQTLVHAEQIAQAAEWLADTVIGGGCVLFVGAGTSGRLGVVEAAECPPTFGTEPEQIRAAMAGGDDAVFRAVEGAEDDADAGRLVVQTLGEGDLVIALSASSVTPYPRGALDAGRVQGARTVLLTCASLADQPSLANAADLVIALDTGAEILSGSTRLKAGSATKAALNAITTAAMVRAGKVFGNLMVDLRQGSAKLRDRAQRITAQATGLDHEAAGAALERAGGSVKLAIVMARRGVDRAIAERLLLRAGGKVRGAIDSGAE